MYKVITAWGIARRFLGRMQEEQGKREPFSKVMLSIDGDATSESACSSGGQLLTVDWKKTLNAMGQAHTLGIILLL